ncbi:NAD-dependent epimerase/dehydratase family protein [Streptomyces luteolifulvus]|jgi:UDP-glucose 4-epimerase|uniref:UDP-glucuronate decarboxylase n=1 Tax=Streptomyces luteolifulvus TaxID=2615112 RepID=A0A6H9URD4_9ACTN|nr:GDP-mannose 4,6-dehydratase [Streptomyces luteolifulvus]KAB1140772.1 NAD-dependent epimerase/dehydratase family protein [Streptomyces luteolifulvus]
MDPCSKYLVTGGAGFIGSHLVDALLADGKEVVVLDNLSTGRMANLARAQKQPRFRFVHGSVLDPLLVDELARECDTVIHLAAAVGVKLIVEQPLKSFITNIRGTETVLESAQRHSLRVLVASTSEIYGKNSSGPLGETSDRILGTPSVVRWSYSTAKAVDEILTGLYHRERGLKGTIVRFFNTVGPRQSPAYGMVIPRFARQAVRGEPLTVHAAGEQRRCFLHVADAVEALMLLLGNPAAEGDTFNVGSSEEISVRELAERVIAQSGSASPLEYVPYAEAYGAGFEDMQRRVPDTTKLRTLTGWQPRHTLSDVLTDAIADARDEMNRLASTSVPGGRAERPPAATASVAGSALAGPCQA